MLDPLDVPHTSSRHQGNQMTWPFWWQLLLTVSLKAENKLKIPWGMSSPLPVPSRGTRALPLPQQK